MWRKPILCRTSCCKHLWLSQSTETTPNPDIESGINEDSVLQIPRERCCAAWASHFYVCAISSFGAGYRRIIIKTFALHYAAVSCATCCWACAGGVRYFCHPSPIALERKQLGMSSVHLGNAITSWDSAFYMYLYNPQTWLLHEATQKHLQHNKAL